MIKTNRFWLLLGISLAFGMLIGCSDQQVAGAPGSNQDSVTTGGSTVKLPDYVQKSSATVKEAYIYAVDAPDVLRYMPCYCGCSSSGHKSNLSCYIQKVNGDGSPVFESHAYG